jgi:hypothetical protein
MLVLFQAFLIYSGIHLVTIAPVIIGYNILINRRKGVHHA